MSAKKNVCRVTASVGVGVLTIVGIAVAAVAMVFAMYLLFEVLPKHLFAPHWLKYIGKALLFLFLGAWIVGASIALCRHSWAKGNEFCDRFYRP